MKIFQNEFHLPAYPRGFHLITDLIYEELVGHINQISLAVNTPNLPGYIEFKHDSVYNRQIGQLKTKLPIKINIYKIKSIEIIPD